MTLNLIKNHAMPKIDSFLRQSKRSIKDFARFC